MSEPSSSARPWYEVENLDDIESPALLIYPDRVRQNINQMIALAGSADRLRPHVKTHKLAEVTAMHLAAGITKFKAATIAECEMLARAGAPDILLAYQPVGPTARRLLDLITAFPKSQFSCVLDDEDVARKLSDLAASRALRVDVLLDIDCGQHRTGIPAGAEAARLYQALCRLPGLNMSGLQAYDGNIRAEEPAPRKKECDEAFAPVEQLRQDLRAAGLPVGTIVAGGTPTFPIHAQRQDVECSPGTAVLWDMGYSSRYHDLNFGHAALVLTRVVSKPARNRVCLDLGHKAIASENPHPRVHFLNAPPSQAVSHSEEHLVLEGDQLDALKPGDCLYGVPWHVCPTVALHNEAVVIWGGRAVERWRVEARDRHLRY